MGGQMVAELHVGFTDMAPRSPPAYHGLIATQDTRAVSMNRSEFQELADLRIDEAAVLLAQAKYDGAYYLAGYAVECGLKACIAKLTDRHEFPPKPKLIHDYDSHEIEKLVKTAGLTTQRDADAATDRELQANWGVVKDWTEESRYERKSESQARELIAAITDAAHGVLPWIKQRW
jgi:HEPN domain-containing protein